jgi:SAM-dependent methyltransferase
MRNSPETTSLAYRFLLTRGEDAKVPTGRPSAPWHNAVLTTRRERDDAIAQVKKLGLPVVSDNSKNWDTLAALDCILSSTSTNARILDAGAELYSRILPWLFLYGYTRLEGINIVFTERKRLGPINYKHGDVTSTDYAPETFDAITCLSVIEHGVDLSAYFNEAARILKPGGLLITSTDYWQTPIDTRGQHMYGVPVHIFTQEQIERTVSLAGRYGLVLTSKIDLSCDEKVVHWRAMNLDYTFVIFTLRKGPWRS